MTSEPNEPETTTPSDSTANEDRNRARIKIGSQRSDSPPPKAPQRVKTVFRTPDGTVVSGSGAAAHGSAKERSAKESGGVAVAEHEEASSSAESQSQSVQSEGSPEDAANQASQPAGQSPQPKPTPLEPGKSVRKLPVIPPSSAKIAVPNIRQALSPELTQELDEALGEMSVDDLLAAEAKGKDAGPAVGIEIESESRQRGTVLHIARDDVFVELPGRNQGVLPLRQFPQPPEIGAVVETIVTRFNAEEGLYELTLPEAAVDVADWSEVAEGMVVEAIVTGHNKGGVECTVNKLRGFIPASQISTFRVEQLEQFLGQKFTCVITEANAERRNLILSRRAMMEREQAESKKKLLAEIATGDIREGIVRTLRDFGAFVDLGGVDGLLHVSQISWDRIKHPSDVLEVGQKVRVKIEKIDPETQKISLTLRDFVENPWTNVATKYPVTSKAKGTISKITEFGAFVRLEGGVEGLVHISEVAHQRVHRVSDFLSEGQEVEVKVLSVDAEAQRISLSLKAFLAKPVLAKKAEAEPEPEPPPLPPSKRKTPLKGGLGRITDGASTGLKW